MAYVGVFFAMLAVTAVSSIVLVIFIDGLLHLMIALSPKRLRVLRQNGWRLEKHDKPWTARLATELRLLLDPREHVGAGLGGPSGSSGGPIG